MEKIFKAKKSLFVRLLCVAFSVVLCLTAAGCGGESKKESGTDSKKPLGVQVDSVEQDVLANSKVANKKYDGKTFTYVFPYTPGEVTERRVAAFNKEHDANIQIVVKTGASLYQTLATAIASGTPYDMVSVYSHFFPNLAVQDLVTPLESYYDDIDLYNNAKPENGGLNKEFNDFYTFGGHNYVVGSAKSVYHLMYIYNKKLFNDNGLEDPWALYKKGEWNWTKFLEMGTQVTDVANGIGFTEFGDVFQWLNLNCVNIIDRQADDTYRSCATDDKMIYSLQGYQQLYLGKEPICVQEADFTKGTTFGMFVASNAYSTYAEQAKNSTAFDRKATNLGAAPVPISNLNTDGKYPLHASVGYAVSKGASDPSIAVCYALYESRVTDTDTGDELQLDPEIFAEIIKRYSEKPFLTYTGFADSNGVSVAEFYRDDIGKTLLKGADVTQTIESNKGIIQKMIEDTVK